MAAGDVRGNPTYYDGDLRRDLIEAARTLIRERGAASLSLREVARAVGVSHAAPAHHFGDRTGLLVAVAAAAFDAFADALEAAVEHAPSTPLGPLTAGGTAYVEYASDHLALFEVMFRTDLLTAGDPDLRRASDRAIAVLQAGVESAQRGGWAPDQDPQDMATTCWALAHGLAVLRSMGVVGSGDAERLTREALEPYW